MIGVKEEVVVHATYRMTTTLRHDPGVVVFPYRGSLESGDQLWNTIESSDCKVVNRAKGICDYEERLYIDPRHYDFGNEDAGAWKTMPAASGSPAASTTSTTSRSRSWSSGPPASRSTPRPSRSSRAGRSP